MRRHLRSEHLTLLQEWYESTEPMKGRPSQMKAALSADEFVSVMPTWSPGVWGTIVNTDKAGEKGTHWVVVIVKLDHDAGTRKERLALDPVEDVRGIVRIIDPLPGAFAFANPLVTLIRERTGLHVRPVENMRWQRDEWSCGYFSLYALVSAPRPLALDAQMEKMPRDFPKTVWSILHEISK